MMKTNPDANAMIRRVLMIGGAVAALGLLVASDDAHHHGPPPIEVVHGETFEQNDERIFVRYWSDGTIDYTVTEKPLSGPPAVYRLEVIAEGPVPSAPRRRLPDPNNRR